MMPACLKIMMERMRKSPTWWIRHPGPLIGHLCIYRSKTGGIRSPCDGMTVSGDEPRCMIDETAAGGWQEVIVKVESEQSGSNSSPRLQ
jgi:hypothetical protein